MQRKTRPRILYYQSFGFLAIIALSWIDESLGLSKLVLGNQSYLPEFHESVIEMLLILGVWLLVSTSTRRVLEHVQRMEHYMRVCAWCRRIKHEGRWVQLEELLEQGFDMPTSHDICHDCLEKQKAALEQARQSENLPPAEGEPAAG